MIVGGYELHLYCDESGPEVPWFVLRGGDTFDHTACWEYIGKNATQAYRSARKEGWKINLKNGTATCPACRAAA